MTSEKRFTTVLVQNSPTPTSVSIPITSPDKPEIKEELLDKWQQILNVLARCIDVPAGLIMRIDKNIISVFLSSDSPDNPYARGASETLNIGLYCETVTGTNSPLIVPDAREDVHWKDNPDMKLNMVSYLGFPILWPDGEIFGTLCVLDNKKNYYSDSYITLMEILKEGIEKDLESQLNNYYQLKKVNDSLEKTVVALSKSKNNLEHSLREKELLLSELHHRVKNNLQILSSLIDLQSATITEDSTKKQLFNIKTRIQSMGIVHNILYSSVNFKAISIEEYLNNLIHNLEASFHSNIKKILFALSIDGDIQVNLETATTMGLIINEIISNSLKHAFSDSDSGTVEIGVSRLDEHRIKVIISDNGSGFPVELWKRNTGLGHELIEVLVEQMNGTLEISSNNGTTFSLVLDTIVKEDNRWEKGY